MKTGIHIKEPCDAGWNNMTPDKNGRFCGTCQKVVIDFSTKSLEEIKTYLSQNKDTCGRYQERHTKSTSWYEFLNRTELFFSRIKMVRFSLFLITILLFFSACYRRVSGRMSAYTEEPPAKPKKHKHKAKQDTTQVKIKNY